MDTFTGQVVGATFMLAFLVALGAGVLYWRSYPKVPPYALIQVLETLAKSYPNQVPPVAERIFDNQGAAFSDALSRRHEFWAALIQFWLSLLVVVFITVLLILKIITAEAGLPILAAFSGAAISQGVSGARTFSSGPRPPAVHAPADGAV
jgi:hypothetical protein